jgi:septal ring factor EnvC (AmiA/AmiB activator)
MKPYNSAIATMAFAASLQFSSAAQADASYLYMIPSIMGMGTSIYQQHQAMAMQEEAQRRQVESLRRQQATQQPASSIEIAELTRLTKEQQSQIAELQKKIEKYTNNK